MIELISKRIKAIIARVAHPGRLLRRELADPAVVGDLVENTMNRR